MFVLDSMCANPVAEIDNETSLDSMRGERSVGVHRFILRHIELAMSMATRQWSIENMDR